MPPRVLNTRTFTSSAPGRRYAAFRSVDEQPHRSRATNERGIQRGSVMRLPGAPGAYDRPRHPPMTSATPMYCRGVRCSCRNIRANRMVSAG